MDNLLTNTLTGTLTAPQLPPTPKALTVPTLTGNNQIDIKTLGASQQQPSSLINLQKAMSLASRTAYNERQTSELGTLGFDPTKVSGNTFASIIGNLERNRGFDISKTYASTMDTYSKVQEQITSRLERLRELEEQKRQWEEEMKFKKKELKQRKKESKSQKKSEKSEKKTTVVSKPKSTSKSTSKPKRSA